jgi:hypothetical protein
LELKGRTCTLHPFVADGIALGGKIDFDKVAQSLYSAIEDELGGAGLGVKLAGPGDTDGEIVITGRFVHATAGSRWKRYLVPFLPGAAAIVEVEGTVADRDIPLDEFHALGKRGLGPLGGSSPAMIASAAETAGRQAARQAIAILVGS